MTTDPSILITTSEFSTDKHIDPVVTRNPNDEAFPLVELVTVIMEGEDLSEDFQVSNEFSTEKHVDPFPEYENLNAESEGEHSTLEPTNLVPELEITPVEEDRVFPPLFTERLDINASATSQCAQVGNSLYPPELISYSYNLRLVWSHVLVLVSTLTSFLVSERALLSCCFLAKTLLWRYCSDTLHSKLHLQYLSS